MSGGKVAPEQALLEFERFATAMKLDLDPASLDVDDRRNLEQEKRRFLRAIENGRLIIDDKGQPVFYPETGEPITFYRPRGATILATDQKKTGQDAAKGFVMVAEMTKQNLVRYHDMPLTDVKICQAVALIFLG